MICLKLPDDFKGNMRVLLAIPPAPAGTAGSRKPAPNPLPKPKKKAKRRPSGPKAPVGTYAYESAPVLRERKAKTRRAKKKR